MSAKNPIPLVTIEPIGTQECAAFCDWHDDESPTGMSGTLKMITQPIYPEPEFDLRTWRQERRIYLSEAAERLGISVVDVANLERGKKRPANGWRDVLDRLERPASIDHTVRHEVDDG